MGSSHPHLHSSPALHGLLISQLRHCFGSEIAVPADLASLLPLVNQAYIDAEEQSATIERSLDLVTRELHHHNERLRAQLTERQLHSDEQLALIKRLEEAQGQLVQAEKMASIGQLAAGVAHEINNPIGYISSNLGTLQTYIAALLDIVAAFASRMPAMPSADAIAMRELLKQHDYDYMREDIVDLLRESGAGVQRVRQIVQDLKDFSHAGEQAWLWADLHNGLNSTLNIAHNETKYVADVERRFGDLPQVHCLASQLNQVFMNLLVNAAHSMAGRNGRGLIVVTTGRLDGDEVFVEVTDNGCGIAEEHLGRIFDPFYTTKPVGQGTGLGLSVSYGIVRRHGGRIEVESQPGQGTRFRVCLPVCQAAKLPAGDARST